MPNNEQEHINSAGSSRAHTLQDIEHINSPDEPIETHCTMLINIVEAAGVELEPAAPPVVGVQPWGGCGGWGQ